MQVLLVTLVYVIGLAVVFAGMVRTNRAPAGDLPALGLLLVGAVIIFGALIYGGQLSE